MKIAALGRNLIVLLAVSLAPLTSLANPELDQLLERVRSERGQVQVELGKREQAFLEQNNEQQRLLQEAREALAVQTRVSENLRSEFSANESALTELEERLNVTMGTLGEMFGVVRQVAGDAKAQFENSVISSQYPERVAVVSELAESKRLPTTAELRKLWFELQREMTESGKVVLYPATVTAANGSTYDSKVLRVGSFNVTSGSHFLNYIAATGELVELGRQPARRYRVMADNLANASSEFTPFPVDPSRGSILSLLVQAPSLTERLQQGGVVGYVIMAILGFGLLLVGERFYSLHRIGTRIKKQLKSDQIDEGNPLGQVMKSYERLVNCNDPDALELKLHEAIVKATPPIERGIPFLKLMAAVAPLLGLLGTVTGMIITFQSITLFGTGDPKLMAGGISQALITTVLGLIAAIPLLLLHSMLSSKSKGLLQILEEQTAGMIAERVEREAVS